MHMKVTCLVGNEALMDADPRGRLSRKHRVCGGKPTNGSDHPTNRRRRSGGECMDKWEGRRSEPREVSLSDEIVFKWSGARNDDRLMMMTVERLTLLYGDHRSGSRRGVNIHIRGAALLKNCVQTKQPPSREESST